MLVERSSVVRDQVGYARSGVGIQYTQRSAHEALRLLIQPQRLLCAQRLAAHTQTHTQTHTFDSGHRRMAWSCVRMILVLHKRLHSRQARLILVDAGLEHRVR
jgi:hypothetical protein